MIKIQFKVFGPAFENGAAIPLIRAATKETLEYGKGVIQEATPVRTGELKRGWHYRTAEGAIYNEVPYCEYVENGTSRMVGRGMARRSIPEIAGYFVVALENHLERLK